MNADALSTAVFVLGSEKGITLLYSINDTEGLIINIEGETRVSKNINSIEGFTLKSFKNGICH
jgi:thiamine biosynthesis lipoprotein ApbE